MSYHYSHCTDEEIKIKMPTHLLKLQQLISVKARLELRNSDSSDKAACKYEHNYTLIEKYIYWSSRAAITKHHQLGGLDNRSWMLEV